VTPSTVIFDFDGTLVKTREASWRLFQRTNAEFDLGVDRPEDFYALFRRNFFSALDEICAGDPARKERVRAHFLNLLRDEYSPDLVPGMADVIHRLAGSCTLVLASSNTMESVRRTLERHDLACCFAHAFTGDLEPDKAASIRCFLADPGYSMRRLCEPEYTEECAAVTQLGEEVVLVTDTVGDVEEAIRCGIRSVGVVWGMHTAEELRAAGAEFVAIWPQELLTHILDDPATALSCTVARSAPANGTTSALDQARRAAETRRLQRITSAATLANGNGRAHACTGGDCGCESCAPAPAVATNGNGRHAVPAIDPVLRDAVARMVNGG
jgi:phosphoglycolate phosphatase